MVKLHNSLFLLAAVVGVVIVSLGITLGNQTGEPVPGWIKIILLPGTFTAIVFPGIHADRFILATVFFNLLVYEIPLILALFMICRKRGKGKESK